MIRSSKLSVKFSNKNKKHLISTFITEYKRVTEEFINILWELPKIPRLIEKNITQQVQTWLTARATQCAAKQASGIVRGTRKKQDKRLFKYNEFVKKGWNKHAKRLKKFIDKANMSKPDLKNVCPELDSRFVKINFENDTTFDGWITLTSLGNKLKIVIPVKKTKHFNSLTGKLKTGVRLSDKSITFSFESEVEEKTKGKTLGLDIGAKTACSLSDGQVTKTDKDGWNLDLIQKKLSRKTKGSKSFAKAQEHRKNYIGWSINQLNLSKCKTLRIENIKNIRRNKKSSRYLSHWTYTEIYDKLEQRCEELGVQVNRVNPTYTSQRCSKCGWVRKRNRKGKTFTCDRCNFAFDADLNAARNISLSLRPIWSKERQLHKNISGFYLYEAGQEPIVPGIQLN